MIVVGGENLIDFIQVEKSGGRPEYRANPGGSPYNCAKALGRLGESVAYLTPISSDSLGGFLAKELEDAGVSLLGDRREEPSSLAVVSIGEGGAPSYGFYRDGTAERQVTAQKLEEWMPSEARAFQLGSLSITDGEDAEEWKEFFSTMKGRGLFTSLDPNVRAAFIPDRDSYLARLDRLLSQVDLLKLSDEDLEWIAPGKPVPEAAAELLEGSSASLAVVTLGAEGSFALRPDGTKVEAMAAETRDVVDTVGAGDVFMGALLAGLSRRSLLNPEGLKLMDEAVIGELLREASTAAAINCESEGCSPPDRDALSARLGTG